MIEKPKMEQILEQICGQPLSQFFQLMEARWTKPEFDSQKKTIWLFRFPDFQVLICLEKAQ